MLCLNWRSARSAAAPATAFSRSSMPSMNPPSLSLALRASFAALAAASRAREASWAALSSLSRALSTHVAGTASAAVRGQLSQFIPGGRFMCLSIWRRAALDMSPGSSALLMLDATSNCAVLALGPPVATASTGVASTAACSSWIAARMEFCRALLACPARASSLMRWTEARNWRAAARSATMGPSTDASASGTGAPSKTGAAKRSKAYRRSEFISGPRDDAKSLFACSAAPVTTQGSSDRRSG